MDAYAKRYNDIMLGHNVPNKTKEEITNDRNTFFEMQERYKLNTKDKKAWDTMFYIMFDISLSSCKKRACGIVIPNLVEKALDATVLSMDLIRRNKGPDPKQNALIAWNENQIIKVLYDNKLQHAEREYSFEAMTDRDQNKYYAFDIDNEEICIYE